MKITILGCGPSNGVPSLARGFGLCDPNNPKNIRTRSAILVQTDDNKNILIDADPEIRLQLLKIGSPKIDAILYTHSHYDHMGGTNDIVASQFNKIDKIPVYATKEDANALKHQLHYLFHGNEGPFEFNIITPYNPFQIGNITITPILQYHGPLNSIGYRINNFAYSTDLMHMDPKGFELLKGIDTWVLGVVSPKQNPNPNAVKKHIDLNEALDWIKKVNPKQTYLTHMGQRMDYETLKQDLPANIQPCYDGLSFQI